MILRDRTMDDKLMYIPNDEKQNYPLYEKNSLKTTNQDLIQELFLGKNERAYSLNLLYQFILQSNVPSLPNFSLKVK